MRKILLLWFCLSLSMIAADENYKLEDIEELYKSNIITKEDYDILKKEILGQNKSELYNLIISNTTIDTKFSIVLKEGINYINLDTFLKDIGVVNYEEKAGIFDIKLGKELTPVMIDFNNKKVDYKGESVEVTSKDFLIENTSYFLSEALFTKIFLSYIDINRKDLTVNMGLSFPTPEKINQMLDIEKQKLENKKDDEVLYRSQRKLFDLGYARLSLGQFYSFSQKEKHTKDWTGEIEYQGAALYGQLTTNYDVKNKELGTLKLTYDQLLNNHKFVIENHPTIVNDRKEREWGFFLYKDKGYFEYGKNIVIHEDVPIGSRAELLYLGTVVDIKDAEDGVVTFSGDLIKSDREYEMKVYTPDNKIFTKIIKTTRDYNRQNKSELSYNMAWYQDKNKGGRYRGNFNMYYGITEKLTMGAGISRTIVTYYDKNKNIHLGYANSGDINFVYGGVTNGLGYTFSTKYSRTFNNDNPNVNASQDYNLSNMVDLVYSKFRLNLKQDNYGREYPTKQYNSYELKYDMTKNITVGYFYSTEKEYNGERESKSGFNFNTAYSFKSILFSASGDIDLKNSKNNTYTIGAYYGGAQNYNVRFTNNWYNDGKDYSATLGFYNNNFGGFMDMGIEGTYDSRKKEYITFRFNMKLADLFTIDTNSDNHGNHRVAIGLDKIIDLKNPRADIRSMDVSRLNIKTFVDENNNNEFDKDEVGLGGVEVEVGNDKIITDKEGNGMMYGISNNIKQNVKVTVKKPHYILDNENIKIYGSMASTLDVYLPIKPMIDLSGYVDLASDLNLSDAEIVNFYSDILIAIKNKDGKVLEYVAPDNTGHFDVSGLFPEEYIIEVSYLGDKYKLPTLEGKLKLSYNSNDENNFNYEVALEVNRDEIKMFTKK